MALFSLQMKKLTLKGGAHSRLLVSRGQTQVCLALAPTSQLLVLANKDVFSTRAFPGGSETSREGCVCFLCADGLPGELHRAQCVKQGESSQDETYKYEVTKLIFTKSQGYRWYFL